MRLRQLARLEAIKIEQELKELREEQGKLEDILGSPATLRRTLVKEIEADAKPVRRRASHADPGRQEGGLRDEGGRRAGHRGREPEGLGAGAQGPRATMPRSFAFKAGDGAVRHLRMPHDRHAAGLRQQRPGLQRGGERPARRPWRRAADDHADRPRVRHPAVHYWAGPGDSVAAAGQHRRLRPARPGERHGVAASAAARAS